MADKPQDKEAAIAAAAERAIAEAAERKKSEKVTHMPKELGGREGLEPTRFGDWEKDGIISDF
ncbi:MAG: DUF1674 domain-containing protein [Pseudomonadota bacterium]